MKLQGIHRTIYMLLVGESLEEVYNRFEKRRASVRRLRIGDNKTEFIEHDFGLK